MQSISLPLSTLLNCHYDSCATVSLVPWENHLWTVPVLSPCLTLCSPLAARSSRWNLSRYDRLSIAILSAYSRFVLNLPLLNHQLVAVFLNLISLWLCSTFWRSVKDLLLSASVDSQLWISRLLVAPSGNLCTSKLLILALMMLDYWT